MSEVDVKQWNQVIGRPALQAICGYEFAALNSNGRLRALTSLIWWLREHNLTWLAWFVVLGFEGWVFHHLLLERTNDRPQEKEGTRADPSPPLGWPPEGGQVPL